MANRVFQNVVYQMKDAIARVVGVVDETGAVIACSAGADRRNAGRLCCCPPDGRGCL